MKREKTKAVILRPAIQTRAEGSRSFSRFACPCLAGRQVPAGRAAPGRLRLLAMTALALILVSSVAFAEAPEHFYNPPENVNPDPNYTPGDFPLGDTNAARMLYQAKKTEISGPVELGDSKTLVTLGAGEISFTSIKNETATVVGYFRNYFGVAKTDGRGNLSQVDLVIDVNSLDTGVPGRNNRILELFFQATRPELGWATATFDQFETNFKNLRKLKKGQDYSLKAKGDFTLNAVTQEIAADLTVKRENQTWIVETAEPVALFVSDFAFAERISELMKSCNHRSLGNRVEVRAKLYFR